VLKYIAYYMNEKDGVGAIRSIALYKMLKKSGVDIEMISKDTFGYSGVQNIASWIINVLFTLLKSRHDLVYISCGPFRPLIFIGLICWFCRHRLIVDFRDGWSVNIASNYGRKEKLNWKNYCSQKIAELIEKNIYKICSAFVVCTPGLKKAYKNIFGNDEKIYMIVNGHMIPERSHINKRADLNGLKIVCAGKFLDYDSDAIARLDQFEDKLQKTYGMDVRYTIYFIGTDVPTAEKLEGRSNVVVMPRLSYSEMVEFLADADVGLAIIRNEELDLGTKVFDYIGLGIPIFDWFKEESMFHSFFKPYLFKDLRKAKEEMPKDGYRFHRKKSLRELLEIIKDFDKRGGCN